MANMKIDKIEGIGPSYGEKLCAAGIIDTDGLLNSGKTKKGRDEIAEKTGLAYKQVLKWVNMADLFRISGVASEYAELLEAAGVDTVKELATRRADNLAAKMAEVNEQKNLTRKIPSESVVLGWVDQAKGLPPMIEH